MDISYKHDSKDNYMVLSDVGVDMNSYDFKMITKNTISGLLPATASKRDNITQIYYKITSKQSLENIYNCSKISGRELLMVIKSIVSNAKNVELYLLDLDYLIIKFEYIYLDLNDYKTYICYYPGEKNSFYESLLQFVQKLLTVTDHTDQMATKLIYGIYEICNKKNYLLSDIEKYLKVYDELTFMENKYYDSGCDKEIIRDDYYDHEIDIKSTNIDKSKKIVNRIKEIFVHPGEKDTKDSYMANKSDLNKPEPLFNSSPPISYNNISYDHESTILLDEDIEKSPHILTGICGCENIAISKFPFVIGKVSEKVDVVINNNMISRIHARLTIKNDIIYIEDLNSKNGTYVNDFRIEPHEMVQLETGDSVRLANNKYILN